MPADSALCVDVESTMAIKDEIAVQTLRQADALPRLASPKPTKKAENDLRVFANKIAADEQNLVDMASPAPADGIDRIWPR